MTETLLPPATVELDQEDEDAWGSPPAPLCIKCEHALCPMCPVPWCDQLLGEELDSCCDTSCTVDPIEFADWKQRAAERMFGRPDHHCNNPIDEHTCWTDELGPYCPTWRRLVRACTMCAARLKEDAPRASYVATGASGLQWYECPEHGELDNLAEDRRVRRVLLCTWFQLLRKLNVYQTTPESEIVFMEPPPAPGDPRLEFVAEFWGIPPKGEQ